MRTVIVNFLSEEKSFPGIFTPGKFRVSLASTFQDVDAGPVAFADIPPGTYPVKVVRLGPGGEELGAASTTVDVPADFTLVAVPITVTVSLADAFPS
jgi:hypothetical protein